MNFLRWLFDATTRHSREAVLYEKSGALARFGFIIFMAVMTGVAIGCEFWMFYAFGVNLVYGLIIMCVYLSMLAVAIEYSSVFSVFGFMSAITGTPESYIEKRKEKKRKNKERNREEISSQITNNKPTISSEGETTNANNSVQKQFKKSHKLIDVLVGIYGAIFTLSNIVMALLLLLTQVNFTG